MSSTQSSVCGKEDAFKTRLKTSGYVRSYFAASHAHIASDAFLPPLDVSAHS
jgi:hypothetical protein